MIDDYLYPLKKTCKRIEERVTDFQERIVNTQENTEIIKKQLGDVVRDLKDLKDLKNFQRQKRPDIKVQSTLYRESDNSDQQTTTSENQSFDINFEENENLCFQEMDDGRQMIIRIKAPENMGKNTLVKKMRTMPVQNNI